jgi:hypothetical protein
LRIIGTSAATSASWIAVESAMTGPSGLQSSTKHDNCLRDSLLFAEDKHF